MTCLTPVRRRDRVLETPGRDLTRDAIIFGSGTRFGVFTSQIRNFLDQTGPLWMKGALVGKVGSVFTGSGTQHGGQECTILSMIPTLLHHGMIVVGLPYSFQGQSTMDELAAVRLTAHLRSLNLTAAACLRRTNLQARAFKATTSRRSLANSKHDLTFGQELTVSSRNSVA